MFKCNSCRQRFSDKVGLNAHLNAFPQCRGKGAAVGVPKGVMSNQLVALGRASSNCTSCGVFCLNHATLQAHLQMSPSCRTMATSETLVQAIPGNVGNGSVQSMKKSVTVTETVTMEPVAKKVTKEVSKSMDITFLLDMSGSMAGAPAAAMERQLINFIGSSTVHDDDTIQVIGFDDHTAELLPCTKKCNLNQGRISSLEIRNLEGFGTGTRLWDAIHACTEQRRLFVQGRRHKVHGFTPKPYLMLVLSDGEDSASNDKLKSHLLHPGIPDFHVHLIGLGNQSFAGMRRLSENCGHIQFNQVDVGAGSGVEQAMEDIFRTKFVTSLENTRRVVMTTTRVEEMTMLNSAGATKSIRNVTNSMQQMGIAAPPPPAAPSRNPFLALGGVTQHSAPRGAISNIPPQHYHARPPARVLGVVEASGGGTCRVCHGQFPDLSRHLHEFPDHRKAPTK